MHTFSHFWVTTVHEGQYKAVIGAAGKKNKEKLVTIVEFDQEIFIGVTHVLVRSVLCNGVGVELQEVGPIVQDEEKDQNRF